MRDATRQTVVWEALRAVLARRSAATGRDSLDIVDAGGGTGGFAVPLAKLGHVVTVVDPTPDSLAALERRAAETGVGVKGLQGDVADLGDLLEYGSADLVLCHSVLEYVDDPAKALGAVGGILREGGAVSVLAANSVAAVVHRALAGQFDEARRLLLTEPSGRRFSREALAGLLAAAGFTVTDVHGVRIFAELMPGMTAESDPDGLIALERAAAGHPVLRDIAAQLHVIAHR
ncbi:methyltransferase domain-containing protein [Sphaerimonospora cavernae]|uniref:Methyltransferase domain-containing protein n=1 Tax=Sphaerimonospora cavernae TaxID=1740611 RepID=A0ABV6U1G4_9ACTN